SHPRVPIVSPSQPCVDSSPLIPQYLTRRIPQNPRYQHIKTRLDTGSSLTKYIEKLEEIKRNYRYRKDELFKRLKVTTFAQLVVQVASLSDETLEVTNEEIHKLEGGNSPASDADAELTAGTNGKGSPNGTPPSPVLFINNTGAGESYRSTLQSLISGVGELDIEKDTHKKADTQAKDTPYPDCPFLLLDVRDRDAYDQCHIVGAYSYPIAMLSRAMNPYTNSILEYVSFIYSAGINSSEEKPTGGMLARASKTNSRTNYSDQDGV
ncbi:hypothetical protein CIB84_013230, partial [Bambusicola thoracicus]